jgi:hypothetical protein
MYTWEKDANAIAKTVQRRVPPAESRFVHGVPAPIGDMKGLGERLAEA